MFSWSFALRKSLSHLGQLLSTYIFHVSAPIPSLIIEPDRRRRGIAFRPGFVRTSSLFADWGSPLNCLIGPGAKAPLSFVLSRSTGPQPRLTSYFFFATLHQSIFRLSWGFLGQHFCNIINTVISQYISLYKTLNYN